MWFSCVSLCPGNRPTNSLAVFRFDDESCVIVVAIVGPLDQKHVRLIAEPRNDADRLVVGPLGATLKMKVRDSERFIFDGKSNRPASNRISRHTRRGNFLRVFCFHFLVVLKLRGKSLPTSRFFCLHFSFAGLQNSSHNPGDSGDCAASPCSKPKHRAQREGRR